MNHTTLSWEKLMLHLQVAIHLNFRFKRIYALNVNNYGKWIDAYEKLNSKYNKPDRLTFAGNFTAGHKYENGNAWVVMGFRDFKGALGGTMKSPIQIQPTRTPKMLMLTIEKNGGSKNCQRFLRIMLATYTY